MDIALDLETMDWQIAETHLSRVSGLDEVAQQLVVRLKMHRGEWGYDLDAGAPWRQELLGKAPDARRVAIITALLADHPKVTRVNYVRIVRDDATRQATIYAQAQTDQGQVTVSATEPAA